MIGAKILEGGAYAEWNQLTNEYRKEGRNEMIPHINKCRRIEGKKWPGTNHQRENKARDDPENSGAITYDKQLRRRNRHQA